MFLDFDHEIDSNSLRRKTNVLILFKFMFTNNVVKLYTLSADNVRSFVKKRDVCET